MNRQAIPTQMNTKPDTVNDKFSEIFHIFTQGKNICPICATQHI